MGMRRLSPFFNDFFLSFFLFFFLSFFLSLFVCFGLMSAACSGEETGWYLENMELAFEESWVKLTLLFSCPLHGVDLLFCFKTYFSHTNHKVTGIPRIINSLIYLQEINLSLNAITELPLELFELKLLRKLNLSWNKITSIPHQISKMASLVLLDLDHNQLEKIPDELSNLLNLGIACRSSVHLFVLILAMILFLIF